MTEKTNTHEIIKVLLVEDDEDDYNITTNKLAEIQGVQYKVDWANTFEAGVAFMSRQEHDVYLADYHLGEHNGLEFLAEAVRLDCQAPVILLTGQGGHDVDVAAIAAGATDYLPKSQLTSALLERSIRHSIQHKRAESAIHTLNTELESRVIERTAQLQVASENLQHSNDILKMLDHNQQGFIEITAHELRTPLTVMIGYISMMKLNPLIKENSALSEILTGIGNGTERLYEVVNSMLDIRRIDSGMLEIIPEQVELESIIIKVVRQLQMEADKTRNLLFTMIHEPGLPLIHLDPMQIEKALNNIIINAIKYTPDNGEITIHTRRVMLANRSQGVEIKIKDNGIGIEQELLELVFEKFFQVGAAALHSSSRMAFKGGGPGLGLAIARGIVQAHGGKVWIESPDGADINISGCAVYLQIPLGV